MIDPQHPSPFTLVMYVERSASDSVGYAKLFVGDQLADSHHFNFGTALNAATVFDNIRIDIATGMGFDKSGYRASVYVTEFEIWAPNQPRARRNRTGLSSTRKRSIPSPTSSALTSTAGTYI